MKRHLAISVTTLACLLTTRVTLAVSAVMKDKSLDYDYFSKGADWTGDCATGKKQSPIDIPTAESEAHHLSHIEEAESLDLLMWQPRLSDIQVSKGTMKDSLYVGSDNGTLAFINRHGAVEDYKLLQFHFHAPSEHTFNGKHYDLEMHMVHQNADGRLAVVAIFFDNKAGGDKDNQFIESLRVRYLHKSDEVSVGEIPLRKLTQRLSSGVIYNYEGSLTTPGCAEIVNWIVLDDPQPLSAKQLAEIQDLWAKNPSFAGGNGNNRETLPLHGRKIYAKGFKQVRSFMQ